MKFLIVAEGGNQTPSPSSCGSEYIWDSTNCLPPHVPGLGSSSMRGCGGKYDTCGCPAEYQYDHENCQSPYELSGDACDRKYNRCNCEIQYYYDSSNCPSSYNLEGSTCDENGVTKYISCNPQSSSSCPISIYDGRANTQAIVTQMRTLGRTASDCAAIAAAEYVPSNVSASDSHFGVGKWHLPALAELHQLYQVRNTVKSAINSVSGDTIKGEYWSSSEGGYDYSWLFSFPSSNRTGYAKREDGYVRAFSLCKNCFSFSSLSGAQSPVIGDIVYSDLNYDSYHNSHNDKIPVGVVILTKGTTAYIVSLDNIGQRPWGVNIDISDVPNYSGANSCSLTIP